jgi:hypothetical protein
MKQITTQNTTMEFDRKFVKTAKVTSFTKKVFGNILKSTKYLLTTFLIHVFLIKIPNKQPTNFQSTKRVTVLQKKVSRFVGKETLLYLATFDVQIFAAS